MQRSEDPSTAAETLLTAGILLPLTEGSPWLQCPEDPPTRIFQTPIPFSWESSQNYGEWYYY